MVNEQAGRVDHVLEPRNIEDGDMAPDRLQTAMKWNREQQVCAYGQGRGKRGKSSLGIGNMLEHLAADHQCRSGLGNRGLTEFKQVSHFEMDLAVHQIIGGQHAIRCFDVLGHHVDSVIGGDSPIAEQ